MANTITPPDLRLLLPPIVACLPTSFVSQRPPPALLPLLSPILRQRLEYLSTDSAESWLALLSWNARTGERLVDLVRESDSFQLHPISGEIEIGSYGNGMYRRLDAETLQCFVGVEDLGISVIYVWCGGHGEQHNSSVESDESTGWKVAEVLPYDGHSQGVWWDSIAKAEETYEKAELAEANEQSTSRVSTQPSSTHPRGVEVYGQGQSKAGDRDDEADDDYWAQYDDTPGRTPGRTGSPRLSGLKLTSNTADDDTDPDAAYFARYAQVQPEMDNDDPTSVDRGSIGQSTLNGNTISHPLQSDERSQIDRRMFDPAPSSHRRPSDLTPDQPTASRSAMDFSSGKGANEASAAVSRLEASASTLDTSSATEVAMRQHVSTSIKSLYRLCDSSGMSRKEFADLVRTEIDMLDMMDEEI